MARKTAAQLDREISRSLAGRRSHSTKSSALDKDDARGFGQYAYRMEQTKAQALAGARNEGFAAHHLGAVEDGWEAERRDTTHGGFVGSSHATRRKPLSRPRARGWKSATRRAHELFYVSEDPQGGKHAEHFEQYTNLEDAVDTLARLSQGSITYGNAEQGPQFMIVWAAPAHTNLLYWTDGDLSAQPDTQAATKAIRTRHAPQSTRGAHGSEKYFNKRFEQTRLKHWS